MSELESIMDFRPGNEFLEKALDWAIEHIFKKVWKSDEFQVCAKGGDESEKFALHKDMPYLSHIITGILMGFRVLDFKYFLRSEKISDNDKEEIEKKLKKATLGYLFHDYNKLDRNVGYKMIEKGQLDDIINRYFSQEMTDLGITTDNIYQIAFSTEMGTEYNNLRHDVNTDFLGFEIAFSKLCDILSSVFNKEGHPNWTYQKDIYFNGEPIISGKTIKRIGVNTSSAFAIENLAKKGLKSVIDDDNSKFFLWGTTSFIYYCDLDGRELDFSRASENFKNLLNKSLKPEKSIQMNDRTVGIAVADFAEITRQVVYEWMSDNSNFKQAFYLENIKIDKMNRSHAESYSDLFREKFGSFSLNLYGKNGLREGLKISEGYGDSVTVDEERLRIFLLRYVQLNQKELLKSTDREEIDKTIKLMRSVLTDRAEVLGGLIGKNQEKSVLLIPFVLGSNGINWINLENEVLEYINRNRKKLDYESILSNLVNSQTSSFAFPDVPDKSEMSMINGFPAEERALGANLYGVRTQSFSNRLLTSSSLSNGKIDNFSKLENVIKKGLLRSELSDGIIFLFFPSAIPFLDMSGFLKKMMAQSQGNFFNELLVSLDQNFEEGRDLKFDTSYFYPAKELNKEDKVLKEFRRVLEYHIDTKMSVKMTYSNAPLLEDQKEVIKIEVGSSIISGMGWNRIRCNRVKEILHDLDTFNLVATGLPTTNPDYFRASDTVDVIRDYIAAHFSLFYHIHRLINPKGQNDRFANVNLRRVLDAAEDLKRLAYDDDKHGSEIMKEIEELAGIAAKIKRIGYKSSGNDRTWMLRESLEVLEKAKAASPNSAKADIAEFEEFMSGHIWKTLSRDEYLKDHQTEELRNLVSEFTKKLLDTLKERLDNKIPTGTIKSYFIDAFEFEYLRASDILWKTGKTRKEGDLSD